MPDQDAPSDPSPPLLTAIDRALTQIHAIRRPARWLSLTSVLCVVGTIAAFLITLVVQAILGQTIGALVPYLFALPLLLVVVIAGVWSSVEIGRSRRACEDLRHLLKRAGRNGIPRSATGFLLEILMAEAVTRPVDCDVALASAVLIPLLQSMQPEDEALFTRTHRDRLHEIVAPGDYVYRPGGSGGVGGKHSTVSRDLYDRLRPAAVSALGAVGDSSAIPLLERLAKQVRHPGLKATTLHSLEQIRERVRSGPEQLLRAGEVPQSPDTLLRSAVSDGTQQSDPEQLLRAESRKEKGMSGAPAPETLDR